MSGGEIVSTFDAPDKVRIGKCSLIEEVIIGEDKLIKFSGKTSLNTKKIESQTEMVFLLC